jgi:DedD protein
MDRNLLERMIGATVLVILLVILAPALLDGRKPPGSNPYVSSGPVIDVPLSKAPVRVETIRLKNSKAVELKATTMETNYPSSIVKPKPKLSSPPAKLVDQWMVQLGSFSAKANAEKYAAKVKASGFPAMVSSFRSGGKRMYRVQVGPNDERSSADRLVKQLKKSGHKGLVMRVNP